MSKHKYIIWRPDLADGKEGEGYSWANIDIIVCYNQGSVQDFTKMAHELMEDFPEATMDTIKRGKITHSSYVNGGSIVSWAGVVEKCDYPGWCEITNPDYNRG